MMILPPMETAIAAMAGLSGFLALMVVFWPHFARDDLETRIRKLGQEKEEIRVRERARLNSPKEISLRSEPRRIYRLIVDRFNLTRQTEDGAVVRQLRMAGYRGQGPLLTFLASRLLAAIGLFVLSTLYVFFVLKLDLPLLTKSMIPVVVGGLGYFAPSIFLKNRITKRQVSIRRAWPDALDLLLICVEAGMSVEGAFRKVSEEIGVQSRALAEELTLTTAELSYLQDRRMAYENLAQRTGLDGVRATVTALIQSEKYGTSIGQSLRVLAIENRDTRMSEAEKKAAALPPKLTVPMILFFLPVLFAVIITPAAIQLMDLP
ncbi:type II secretion system F family protein [Pelagibacterium sp. H642]|uniref:type II secretion system F family protein n=1 Tax=Pelagibacterium sp. H642 TaxID=1881069 RepID=UPI002814FA7B|nr:type II secretion system F family protein [Pelagibacterium sp. H642]WMT92875.1 type II secretion system F family protein [Pelagibacterium sp. H642]